MVDIPTGFARAIALPLILLLSAERPMHTYNEVWPGRAIVLLLVFMFGVVFWSLLAWAVASWLE